MRILLDWLHDRTGYQDLLHDALYERIPGGARWRYVWGSTLVFTFMVQVISGVFLWTAYSPSAQTAWESVYYIQNEMYMGSIVRGIHHYAAQLMVILLAIHLMQVIIDGAYRAPREINFWLGLILMQIVLGLSLTGYLLPWDQKGYYATQVTTKIVGATPMVGPQLQQLAQGGPEYGHHTLTRFFAMHAGVLPGALIAFLVLHIYVFRRHGITTPDPDRAPAATFWPDQVLKDGVACLGVLAVIMLCAIFKSAELSAPANPSEAYSAARPEWYFLFLFRFLRFEAIEHFGLAFGAIYVPGALMVILTLMPLIAIFRGGHRFNVIFMWLIAFCVLGLTGMALVEDARDPDHQAAIAEAERDAHRVQELAALPDKIPVEGAGSLLLADPFTKGPRLFEKHCAACHRFDGHNGRGKLVLEAKEGTGDGHAKPELIAVAPAATDLQGFANRAWWREILVNFEGHFKPTTKVGYEMDESISSGMASWSNDHRDALLKPENEKDLEAIIEYLHSLSGQTEVSQDLVTRGSELLEAGTLTSGDDIMNCADCHTGGYDAEFEVGAENDGVPELNQYGSYQWLTAFLKDPGSSQFYGEKNKMPAYANKMSELDLDLLVRYLIGDYSPTHVEDYKSMKSTLVDMLKGQEAGSADETTPEPSGSVEVEPSEVEPSEVEPSEVEPAEVDAAGSE